MATKFPFNTPLSICFTSTVSVSPENARIAKKVYWTMILMTWAAHVHSFNNSLRSILCSINWNHKSIIMLGKILSYQMMNFKGGIVILWQEKVFLIVIFYFAKQFLINNFYYAVTPKIKYSWTHSIQIFINSMRWPTRYISILI